QTPGSRISNLLAMGTSFTGNGNLYCQWELSPGSGNALCILFPTQATAQSNQNFHLNEMEKIRRMNYVSLKAIHNQIDMMNTASTLGSGSILGNTVANPKGKLKAITTRSGLATDGPTVPTHTKSVNPEEDECVKETYTDPDLAEYTIKVLPPPVQKPKPLIQRHFVLHTRDSPLPYIPYPSRMLKQKQQEKDDI
nr:hypothetical protein [Tanacetum cinerariifolium]